MRPWQKLEEAQEALARQRDEVSATQAECRALVERGKALKEEVEREETGIKGEKDFKVERRGANEEREMRRLVDPRLPTEEEKKIHDLTHIPYRNWCPHCVRGRGKDLDHRKGVEEERGLSEFSFDYCFPGD